MKPKQFAQSSECLIVQLRLLTQRKLDSSYPLLNEKIWAKKQLRSGKDSGLDLY